MSPMQKRFRAKGALDMLRENVMEILNLRFGSVPPEVEEAVQVSEDGKFLRSLHLAAVQVPSLDEFRLLL